MGRELGRFEELLGMGQVEGDILRILGHATMSTLGFYVGIKEKGFISFIGWTLGVLSAAGTVLDVVGLVQLLQKEETLSGCPFSGAPTPKYPTFGARMRPSVRVNPWRKPGETNARRIHTN